MRDRSRESARHFAAATLEHMETREGTTYVSGIFHKSARRGVAPSAIAPAMTSP